MKKKIAKKPSKTPEKTKSPKKEVVKKVAEKVEDVPVKTATDKSPKKKKLKKLSAVEGEKSSYFKSVTRVINPSSGLSLDVYINVDSDHRVDKLTPKGTRILVARYPDFYKIYLYKTHSAGDPHFPYGGVTAYNTTYEMFQCFSYESVAIHPDGESYRFRSDIAKDDMTEE